MVESNEITKKDFSIDRDSVSLEEQKNDNKFFAEKSSYKFQNLKEHGKGLKILTPKQMLQRLPIALAQVKSGNKSENLINEIRQLSVSSK